MEKANTGLRLFDEVKIKNAIVSTITVLVLDIVRRGVYTS